MTVSLGRSEAAQMIDWNELVAWLRQCLKAQPKVPAAYAMLAMIKDCEPWLTYPGPTRDFACRLLRRLAWACRHWDGYQEKWGLPGHLDA
jgi:hypothetical protein